MCYHRTWSQYQFSPSNQKKTPHVLGEHRGLGPSVSKVRSLKMDRKVWTEELVQVQRRWLLVLSTTSFGTVINGIMCRQPRNVRKLHTHLPSQVFLSLGNERANSFWAANVPPSEALTPSSSSEERRRFITNKYRQGKYRKYHMLYGNQTELNNVSS